jgi:hypothetical protein
MYSERHRQFCRSVTKTSTPHATDLALSEPDQYAHRDFPIFLLLRFVDESSAFGLRSIGIQYLASVVTAFADSVELSVSVGEVFFVSVSPEPLSSFRNITLSLSLPS